MTLPKTSHGIIHDQGHLKNALDYITDPEKTRDYELVSGQLLQVPENATDEMMATRNLAQLVGHAVPKNERLAWHLIQSFDPNDQLTPEQVHEIGVRTMKQIVGETTEFVIATHIDKAHIHNHIIFNAIDSKTLQRFHANKKDLALWREISDRVSEEYGAKILESDLLSNSHTKYHDYLQKNSYREEIKSRLNFLMHHSKNWEDFKVKAQLLDLGVNDNGKYVTYRLLESDQKRNIRDRSLKQNDRFLKTNMEEAFKKNKVTYSVDEIKAAYDSQQAKKEAEVEIKIIVEPWQVQKATGKYLYLEIDFGLAQSGVIRLPATKVDKLENGNYQLFIKRFDKFYFIDSNNHEKSRLIYGATLAKQMRLNNGEVPVYSNNALKTIHHLIDELSFMSSHGVDLRGKKTFQELGDELVEGLAETRDALDILDKKLLELNEATKTHPDDEAVSEIKALQAERRELQQTFDQLISDIETHQKIHAEIKQSKEKEQERGL